MYLPKTSLITKLITKRTVVSLNMLSIIFVFVLALAGCLADSPATQAPQGLYCGYTPPNILSCIGNPRLLSVDTTRKCISKSETECDALKCAFTESGWMDGSKINKKKVSDHFDQYAADHPAWTPAVNHLKAACLGDHDLPAQGVYINCPAYDIIHCIHTSFIRNATPSQWTTTEQCRNARSYAAGCPVCPDDCFAPQVPYGACSACLSLPRSS